MRLFLKINFIKYIIYEILIEKRDYKELNIN